MKNVFSKTYLLIAGLVMLLVGFYIAIATHSYMATMTTQSATTSINMLSDLRGMGGLLLVIGAYVFASGFYRAWQPPALIVATAVYASFVLFRSLSFALDGLPDMAIMVAYLIELGLATVGGFLVRKPDHLLQSC